MPTPTDLVTDLPADFEVFGQAVDSSLADLLGGTTGQVLAKNSNTNMDFVWVAQDDSNAIQNAIVDAKGDLIAATANDTPARLAVGANSRVLTADSTAATGLAWAQGGITKIASASFSNVASVSIDDVFSTTYKNYLALVTLFAATGSDDLQLQYRYAGPTTETTSYYGSQFNYDRFNSLSTAGYSNATQATILQNAGGSGGPCAATFNFSQVGNSSQNPLLYGHGIDHGTQNIGNFAMMNTTARIYTGFLLKSSSTNITGFYAVYGWGE
jgi:hypothetical protein